MITRIENGVTIISTGDAEGGIKNKNGHRGIHYYKPTDRYAACIHYKRKKYHLGFSKDIQELVEIRKEAEVHIRKGNFVEWFESKKGKWHEKES